MKKSEKEQRELERLFGKYDIPLRKSDTIYHLVHHDAYDTTTALTPVQYRVFEVAIVSRYIHDFIVAREQVWQRKQQQAASLKLPVAFVGFPPGVEQVREHFAQIAGKISLPVIPEEWDEATARESFKDFSFCSQWLTRQEGVDVATGENSNLYYGCLD